MSSAVLTQPEPLPCGLDLVGLIDLALAQKGAVEGTPQKTVADDRLKYATKPLKDATKPSVPKPSLLGKRKLQIETISQVQMRRGAQVFLAEADMDDQGRVGNTQKAYDPKVQEFREFCDSLYGAHPAETRYTVDQERVLSFMIYVAFREQKTRGKKKTKGLFSMTSQWNRICCQLKESGGGMSTEVFKKLEPDNGVGYAVVNTTKSALKTYWSQQVEDHVNTHTEDSIFCCSVKRLIKYVQM